MSNTFEVNQKASIAVLGMRVLEEVLPFESKPFRIDHFGKETVQNITVRSFANSPL